MMVDIGPLSSTIDLATGATAKCRHEAAEPVRLLLGGELVAWLCPACDAQLPAQFVPPILVALEEAERKETEKQLLAIRVRAVKERFGA